jgi:hypothetical protein
MPIDGGTDMLSGIAFHGIVPAMMYSPGVSWICG